MMSCLKSVLEITMYMPKNRAQVSKELGGWRGVRAGKIQSGQGELTQLQRELSELLKAIVQART